MSSYALRPATEADEPFLYACYRRTMRAYVEAAWGWDETFQAASFKQHLPWRGFSVITVGSENAGAAFVVETPEAIELELIVIDETYRRRGIGSDFVAALLQRAREEQKPVRLRVIEGNPARLLYTRLGFAAVGGGGGLVEMQAGGEP